MIRTFALITCKYKNRLYFYNKIPCFAYYYNTGSKVLASSNVTKDNTPPLPLNDAHLGGFFF